MDIQGMYSLDDFIKIDSNNAYANFCVYVHELAHFQLEKNTLFGILTFLVKHISEEPNMGKLSGFVKVFCDASERTNECYAMCKELVYIKSQMPQYFTSYKYLQRQSVYYTKYQFKELEFLFQQSQDIFIIDNIIDRIFTLAMNISLPQYMNCGIWESQKNMLEFIISHDSYYPDRRIEKLLDALKKELNEKSINNVTDQDLIHRSQLPYNEWTTANVIKCLEILKEQLISNNFSVKLLDKNLENLVANNSSLEYNSKISEDFERKIHQAIIPDCLSRMYSCEPIKDNMVSCLEGSITVITIYDNKDDILLELTDTINGKKYSLILNKHLNLVDQLVDSSDIVFYFDDIEIVKTYWKSRFNKRFFVQLVNIYDDFIAKITDYVDNPYAFLYSLNHGVFFLFVKGNDNFIFFTCQNKINLDYIEEDFKSGKLKNVYFDTNTGIDGIFCTEPDDWKHFLHIVLYASEARHGDGTLHEFVQNIMLY